VNWNNGVSAFNIRKPFIYMGNKDTLLKVANLKI